MYRKGIGILFPKSVFFVFVVEIAGHIDFSARSVSSEYVCADKHHLICIVHINGAQILAFIKSAFSYIHQSVFYRNRL